MPLHEIDEVAARELEIYIENDADLYHRRYIPIVKNLMGKIARGIFDPERAVDLFMYLVDDGARRYIDRFGVPGQRIDEVFNRTTRRAVAMLLRDHFVAEAELGNYDQYLPKYARERGGEIGPVAVRRPRAPRRRG